MRQLTFILLLGLILSCEEKNPIPFPDFSNCNCGAVYDPVCGVDGKSYLNSCLADCIGVGIADTSGNCDSSMIVLDDTLSWPIQFVCWPVQRPDDATELRILSDGTVIYQRNDGSLFRGNQNMCRCLPPDACIDGPDGGIALNELKKGDIVFSLDKNLREIVVPVGEIQKVRVAPGHFFVELMMEDGSSLKASAMHPLADGRLFGEIQEGDWIAGKRVESKMQTAGHFNYTMDLLPESYTGAYRIDGYWYGSTMDRNAMIGR